MKVNLLCRCIVKHVDKSNFLGNFADIVTIISLVLIYLAYKEFKSKAKKEKLDNFNIKLHVLRAIQSEIDRIAIWTSFDVGGYDNENKKDWFNKELIRAHSGSIIYQIENSFLANLSILPGFTSLGEEVSEKVSWVNQWILNFNNQLEEIRVFKSAIPFEKYLEIDKKILNGGLKDMDIFERTFVTNLMKMIIRLHFKIIGNEETKSLFYWHKELTKSLEKMKKEVEGDLALIN